MISMSSMERAEEVRGQQGDWKAQRHTLTHTPLTQSQDTQPDDDLLAGSDPSDESVQNAVVTDKRHHGFGKLSVAGDVEGRAAVEQRQRFADKCQRSQVTDCRKSPFQSAEMNSPGRNGKFGTFGESVR